MGTGPCGTEEEEADRAGAVGQPWSQGGAGIVAQLQEFPYVGAWLGVHGQGYTQGIRLGHCRSACHCPCRLQPVGSTWTMVATLAATGNVYRTLHNGSSGVTGCVN